MGITGSSIISFDSTGASIDVSTPEGIVKEKIYFLLTTNKGEIPNDLNYGADLIHFVHRPLDDYLKVALEATIRAELGVNMPFVIVKEIVFSSYKDRGGLSFTLFYELAAGFQDSVDILIQGG